MRTSISTLLGAAGGLLLVLAGGNATASPTDLFPPSGSVLGWKLIGGLHTYDGSSLYNLVDGEADAIKQYAFSSCADGRYSPTGSARNSIDVNVYDMSDPLDAFGLFSHDRQGGEPIDVGA